MTITQFDLNIDNEYANYNLIKDTTLGTLLKEKYITKEQYDKFLETYQIAIVKKKWWQRVPFRKSADENDYFIQIVKIL